MQRQALAVLSVLTVKVPQIQFFDVVGRFLGTWVFFDESLLCQWSRCDACEVVEGFHTFPTRSLALFAFGPWTLFPRAPCIWLALGPVFTRQFTVAFWRISVFFYVVVPPELFAHGNLYTTSTFPRWLDSFCAMLDSTVDTNTLGTCKKEGKKREPMGVKRKAKKNINGPNCADDILNSHVWLIQAVRCPQREWKPWQPCHQEMRLVSAACRRC